MDNCVKNGVYIKRVGDEEKEIAFSFQTKLSANDKIKFVNSVTNLLIDDKAYNGIIKDMIFDFVVIDIFTDIDISDITEAPNSVDRIEDFLETTNAVDVVLANVDAALIQALRLAVDDNIMYRTGINHNSLSDALAGLLRTVDSKIGDSLLDSEQMLDIAQKLSELNGGKLLDAYATTDMFKRNQAERDKTAMRDSLQKIVDIASGK